jgi:hypothetical protein
MSKRLICKDGVEHRIGQKYDERRGVGNGPQICLHCGETLTALIQSYCAEQNVQAAKTRQALLRGLKLEISNLLDDQINLTKEKTNE